MTGNMIHLFLFFLACLGGIHSDLIDKKGLLASVREYPQFLHKCSAAFIHPKLLVSTGACVICARSCRRFVRVVYNELEDPDSPIINVVKHMPHPKYTGKGADFDVGLLVLEKPADNVMILTLPEHDFHYAGVPSGIFRWRFTENELKYHLVPTRVKALSNEVCSEYLHEYISVQYVCVINNDTLSLGPADHGSPVVGFVRRNKTRVALLLGLFSRLGVEQDTRMALYESVFPYLHWLHEEINNY